MLKNLQKLSLADLEIVAVLPHYQSLRALARWLGTTASNIAKKISAIEEHLNKELIKRTPHGYSLTSEGERLAKLSGHILQECEGLVSESHLPGFAPQKWITVGSRGFINALLAPLFVESHSFSQKDIGFRFIDFSPEETVVAAFRASLDVAITLEECFLGQRWQSCRVGETRRILLARRGHPLEKSINIASLADYKVLRSAYWDGNAVVSSGDLLPNIKKHWGHEIQTAATAIPVVLGSDCVAFLPRIAAGRKLSEGVLVEIFSQQTPPVVMPIYLHVNQDTVSQKIYKNILSTTEKAVKQFG